MTEAIAIIPGAPITVPTSYDKLAVDNLAVEMIAEAEGLLDFTISDAETAKVLASVLQLVLQNKDATDKERKKATTPLNQLKRTIDSWFNPAIHACELVELRIKTALSTWDQLLESQRREAFALAQSASIQQQPLTMVDALTVANSQELAERPPEVCFRRRWVARCIAVGLMPEAYILPNQKAIDAYAAKYSIDETPEPLPGVEFTRESSTIGYR